jgi:hypothetical protein
MKKTTVILLIVPLLGIAIFYLTQIRGGAKTSAFVAKTEVVQHESRKSKISTEELRDNSFKVNDSRAKDLDNLTLMYLDSANEASKLKSSDFGKNGDFLMSKHKELFDMWNLNNSQRNKFVSILSEQSIRMAEVSLKASTSWPLEVGHSANRKLNSAHIKAQVDEYRRIQADTRQKLTDIVGANRVSEFEKTRSKSSKDDD